MYLSENSSIVSFKQGNKLNSNIESKSMTASAKNNYYAGQRNKPKAGNFLRTNFHSKSSSSFFNPAQLEFDFPYDDSVIVLNKKN